MTSNTPSNWLPGDVGQALLVGRVWRKAGEHEGPSVVLVRNGEVIDITASAPTTADLFDREVLAQFART
ncbi:fumarylacetoacetate hydrolase, partial [Paraburkholderia sp. BR14261]